VYFSGKITNSIKLFLSRQGASLDIFYDQYDFSAAHLLDPTGWIEARKLENFLRLLELDYSNDFQGENLIEKAGHDCFDLRGWGVLDSVLRIIRDPMDIFTQPQRFISYFISPAPPIGNIQRGKFSFNFELPISHEEFPNVTTYIRAALEVLPTFMGRPTAQVQWKGTKIYLDWSDQQPDLFAEEISPRNIHPDFIQQLVLTLEDSQKDLESIKKEMCGRDDEISYLKNVIEKLSNNQNLRAQKNINENALNSNSLLLVSKSQELQSDFLQLRDYMVRSQQLVKILVEKKSATPQVQEAMRRIDWEMICKNFPQLVSKINTDLGELFASKSHPKEGDMEMIVERKKKSLDPVYKQ